MECTLNTAVFVGMTHDNTMPRTHSSFAVPLLLALHNTTVAMTPAMAADSRTPPMKPPIVAPAATVVQPSVVVHNDIIHNIASTAN